jgi:FkbM family methyltransferase
MRKIYQFTGPVRMIEGRHGHLLYNQHCHWVGKALETYGEYCEHEVDLFSRLIKQEDNVWEIGANTGSQAVPLAQAVSKGHYIAFEPQYELFNILAGNLAINGLHNARCLNIALGEQNGAVELPPVNYEQPNNFGGISLLGGGGSGTRVELHRIDDLNYLPQPNFMKIDVEGMESMVLRGGRETILRMRPIMYIENDRPDRSKELIELLWALQYDLHWHITPYFNEKNFFGIESNIYGKTSSFNMLCMPREKGPRIQGLQLITDANFHPLAKR